MWTLYKNCLLITIADFLSIIYMLIDNLPIRHFTLTPGILRRRLLLLPGSSSEQQQIHAAVRPANEHEMERQETANFPARARPAIHLISRRAFSSPSPALGHPPGQQNQDATATYEFPVFAHQLRRDAAAEFRSISHDTGNTRRRRAVFNVNESELQQTIRTVGRHSIIQNSLI